MAVDLKTVDALQGALTFHRDRHTVLAGNIANIDTPNYRSQDLRRAAPGEATAMSVTTEGHLQGTSQSSGQVFDDAGALQTPDGNAVSLERELGKIDANRARYATASELVSRRLALLRYAAGDGT